MRVLEQATDDPSVTSGKAPARSLVRLMRSLKHQLNQFKITSFGTDNRVLHSPAWSDSGLPSTPEVASSDIVNLHWLGFDTLSIEEIGYLRQPLVWTLHDQWAFCGAEHYTGLGVADRFSVAYTDASRPGYETGPDLNRQTWLRKRRAWRQPIRIVCPSTWMADCARRSTLMASWPITVIPYPIDLASWAPVDQRQARLLLQLPQDRPLVLFGAMGGTADPRKGADLLLEGLQRFHNQVAGTGLEQLDLVVFGQARPVQPPDLGFPIHYMGRLHDDISLRLLYAASDVFVIPSRQDNLPNTGLEAHACGTPVVAFRTGGLVDIVADRSTGALAEPFDPTSLAAAIRWVLEDPHRRRQLGAAARQRAERLWDTVRVEGLVADVYGQAVEQGRFHPDHPRYAESSAGLGR